MQVKSIAEMHPLEHPAILLTFIKLPFVIKIFVNTPCKLSLWRVYCFHVIGPCITAGSVTFCFLNIFVLAVFELLFYTGFTVAGFQFAKILENEKLC